MCYTMNEVLNARHNIADDPSLSTSTCQPLSTYSLRILSSGVKSVLILQTLTEYRFRCRECRALHCQWL